MVVVERYPDLKANQNFIKLQDQLEGTENRIAVERRRFNEVTQEYNTYIRKFPQTMLAGMYGFEKKGYFEADQGADEVPEVSFD
jgi:LemA protein